MIQQIRKSKCSKIVASTLSVMILMELIAPVKAYALTEGPSQPEFKAFTPIGTSDMVDLTSGDFNYNIPVMDVGGYPLNLAYNSGVSMDQEASWVGLGWNLNVGQINREVRGIPDDFSGDQIKYENNLKKNKTVGMVFNINPQFAGLEALSLGVNAGLTVEYNNYEGITFRPSYGFSFEIANSIQVGMNISSSATEGASISPTASMSNKMNFGITKYDLGLSNKTSIGLGYNSRQGLTNLNMSTNFGKSLPKVPFGLSSSASHNISFINETFTPSKRTAFSNTNFTLSISGGPDFWSIDAEAGVSAYGTFQEIQDKDVDEKSYGYENTHKATTDDILDFNRENDRPASKNTQVLPTVNYTYDIYSIQGQGIGGTFRPFRGQAGYVFDQYVADSGSSLSLGGEIEGASGFHVGFDFKSSPSSSHTGLWNTLATPYFKEQTTGNNQDYESVYYKVVGEHRVDSEADILNDKLGGYDPIALKINGTTLGKTASNKFIKEHKNVSQTPYLQTSEIAFNGKLKRRNREVRNQVVQKITKAEAIKYGFTSNTVKVNQYAQPHHAAAYKVTNNDGGVYMFGETAYNTTKKEASFAVNSVGDCKTGIVQYSPNSDNSIGNVSGIDNYFNRVTTPAYAHTYLLSTIFSPDYEDLTGDGPSDDDLGAYTRFNYKMYDNEYNWRIPYEGNSASYNAGLNSHKKDQKGSYVYGKKELKYIRTIETKTHVAYFQLSARKDGLGVLGEEGGRNTNDVSYKIDKIYLFSKPEYEQFRNRIENNNSVDDPTFEEMAKYCTKVAHFEYDYSLCKKIGNTTETGSGKLTLTKVYFTYRNSNMGKYTPYIFHYDTYNPDYHLKSYDYWGNYKPISTDANANCNVNSAITTPEFPFVQQESKALQDQYASAWSLSSVELPSGGKINLEYETDDYQYVQDRKAMRMMMVSGCGTNQNPTSLADINKDVLYSSGQGSDARYIYIKIDNAVDSPSKFVDKYLSSIIGKPVYFNFMLNMSKAGGTDSPSYSSNEFDYVSGYFEIDKPNDCKVTQLISGSRYAIIPMKLVNMEGGLNGNADVNPIAKAGWYFGRSNLNRLVYGDLNGQSPGEDVKSIAQNLVSSIGAVSELFTGPNARLRNYKIARRFIPQKSWIRLQNPNNNKWGGGSRVKKIVMLDNWASMINMPADNTGRYESSYGQEYKYELENGGGSSGVATYEPVGSKENPFVEPFYDNGERLIAPRELNYVEKPFGECFYPAPTITYSRVEVKNITPRDRQVNDATYSVKKHATGKVVSSFYTSKDFPTRTLFTQINKPSNYYSNEENFANQFFKSLVGAKIETNTELTLSQGFVVHTNDMNGKEKKTEVYNEAGALISKTESYYSTSDSDPTVLNNKLPTVTPDGKVTKDNEIGVHYDVVTDFRESYSNSVTFGLQGNLAGFIIGIFPIIIPMGVPERAEHTSVLHTTTTTKVIHTTGILKEKIAYDVGSRVSTKNLAWDSKTGEVVVTETNNEYNDNYYSVNFPAYWYYGRMGMAAENIDIAGTFIPSTSGGNTYFKIAGLPGGADISQYLKLGDEIFLYKGEDYDNRFWVFAYNNDKTGVRIMDRSGQAYSVNIPKTFRVYRSGNANMQASSMASVTMMRNPISDWQITSDDFRVTYEMDDNYKNPQIINASAIEYNDLWGIQCEYNLPTYILNKNSDGTLLYDETLTFNPYVFNLLGEYRPVKSYAYLSSRKGNLSDGSPRNHGYFKKFSLFYTPNGDGGWQKDYNDWTFASKVTQFSPFGQEIENADALNRYSSAQYGYHYKLPVAVASNTRYAELGFDGAEDYDNFNSINPHFAFTESIGHGASVTNRTSHTGQKSIAVNPGGEAVLIRKIDGCKGSDSIVYQQPVKVRVTSSKTAKVKKTTSKK